MDRLFLDFQTHVLFLSETSKCLTFRLTTSTWRESGTFWEMKSEIRDKIRDIFQKSGTKSGTWMLLVWSGIFSLATLMKKDFFDLLSYGIKWAKLKKLPMYQVNFSTLGSYIYPQTIIFYIASLGKINLFSGEYELLFSH